MLEQVPCGELSDGGVAPRFAGSVLAVECLLGDVVEDGADEPRRRVVGRCGRSAVRLGRRGSLDDRLRRTRITDIGCRERIVERTNRVIEVVFPGGRSRGCPSRVAVSHRDRQFGRRRERLDREADGVGRQRGRSATAGHADLRPLISPIFAEIAAVARRIGCRQQRAIAELPAQSMDGLDRRSSLERFDGSVVVVGVVRDRSRLSPAEAAISSVRSATVSG